MKPRTELLAVLDELAALGADRDRLAELAERLRHDRIRVLVAGEAKRGKSTLVNALLHRAVLPVGVTPVTAITTVVRHGRNERAEAAFADGHVESRPLDDLAELVTEDGNPGNRLGLSQVTVFLDVPVLSQGVELVDTPGTGSIFDHNTAEAEWALESMDAALFVLTADPPLSAAERDLFERVTARSVRTFVLLNKVDRLEETERSQAREFVASHLGCDVRPVSARLNDHDPGFVDFAEGFGAYLAAGRTTDLTASVAGHLRRTAERLLDEVRLSRRAAEAPAERVALFRERLTAVTERRRDAADLAEAERRRILRSLNERAENDAARLTARVTAGLRLDGASAEEIERRGRDDLVASTRKAAEQWRSRQCDRLERELSRLQTRMLALLTGELSEIRDAAAELLDLDLSVPDVGGPLAAERTAFLSFAEHVGQTELLAGAIRRHLPGEFGRRRAREHVLGKASELVPRQIGRIRANLQYQLAESVRALVREIDRRYGECVDGLIAAMDAVQPGAGFDALNEREAALRGLLDRLIDPADEEPACLS